MSTDPTAIVNEYFSRMKSRDLAVVDLFHEDARLVGLGTEKAGRRAIQEFYGDVIANAGPSPTLVAGLLTDGDRVAAEIRIALRDGSTVHAVDLFHVEEGRIRSLTYFIANHPVRGR